VQTLLFRSGDVHDPGPRHDPRGGPGGPALPGGVGVSALSVRRRAPRRLADGLQPGGGGYPRHPGDARGADFLRHRRLPAVHGPLATTSRNASSAAVTATLRDSTPLAMGILTRLSAMAITLSDTPSVSL